MKDTSPFPLARLLQGAACTVIILWGVWASSELLGPLLLGLFLAYIAAPFPRWLMHRFHLSKATATAGTAVVLAAAGLFAVFTVEVGVARLAARLPVYEQSLTALNEQVQLFLGAHGIEPTSFSFKKLLTPERFSELAVLIVPQAGGMIAKALLIFLLAFAFVMEMLPDAGVKQGYLAEALARHGSHTKKYMVLTAKTAGINAVVNSVFLLVMGVDEAIFWSFLYFFLDFVPTLGFAIALVPPTFLTLLTQGWTKALLVAGGLILTNLIVDNIVTPMFAKRAMSISFLEITLSLVGWGFLLGLPGAVGAVPLTLASKEFIAKNARKGPPALEQSE